MKTRSHPRQNVPIQESPLRIFLRFLRFGLLAWGGPIAQIAMIRQELVDEEAWISKERFNRVLAVYQALPGPEAHELCVYLGMVAGGRVGGLLAGLGFMLPGFLLMLLLSWVYVTYGITSTLFASAFYGMQPAVVALIVRGLQRIGQHALQDRWLWGIAVIAFALQLINVNFVLILLASGIFYTIVRRFGLRITATSGVLLLIGLLLWRFGIEWVSPAVATTASTPSEATPFALLLAGLRTGLLTFGGAYSAISFLRHDAVTVGRWLTDSEFLDGIAIGGILPAPLIIFGTFVGYLAGKSVIGAFALTAGIFFPAFGFSLIGHEWIERLIDTLWLHSFFDGITAGVVGLIAATALLLLPTAIHDLPSALIFLLALWIVIRSRSKASTPIAVLLGAVLGWILHYTGLV